MQNLGSYLLIILLFFIHNIFSFISLTSIDTVVMYEFLNNININEQNHFIIIFIFAFISIYAFIIVYDINKLQIIIINIINLLFGICLFILSVIILINTNAKFITSTFIYIICVLFSWGIVTSDVFFNFKSESKNKNQIIV